MDFLVVLSFILHLGIFVSSSLLVLVYFLVNKYHYNYMIHATFLLFLSLFIVNTLGLALALLRLLEYEINVYLVANLTMITQLFTIIIFLYYLKVSIGVQKPKK